VKIIVIGHVLVSNIAKQIEKDSERRSIQAAQNFACGLLLLEMSNRVLFIFESFAGRGAETTHKRLDVTPFK
jgi:hypothetical protein